MTNPWTAAFVYAPGATEPDARAIRRAMLRNNWYRADTLVERPEDASRPARERPVLIRALIFAPVINSNPDGPGVVLVHHRSALGRDEEEQAGVVRHLLDKDVRVVAVNAYEKINLDERWFRSHVADVSPEGRAKTSRIYAYADECEALEGVATAAALAEWRLQHPHADRAMVPTSWIGHHYADACERAWLLRQTMNTQQIVRDLQLHGYRAEREQVVWYPAKVEQAIKNHAARVVSGVRQANAPSADVPCRSV